MASPATIDRKWYVVDAEGKTLGRLASEVAKVLRGKNKAIFTPHIDTGDYVIVVNADKVKVTGKKLDQKIYYHHSDYIGGMKETTLRRYTTVIQDTLEESRRQLLRKCSTSIRSVSSSSLVRECFQRDLLDVRCIQSYSYTLDQITNMQLRSLRH